MQLVDAAQVACAPNPWRSARLGSFRGCAVRLLARHGLDVMVLEGGYKVRITTAKHPAGVLEPKKTQPTHL